MKLQPPFQGEATALRLPWPLPAVLCWLGGLLAWQAALWLGAAWWQAFACALLASALGARSCTGRWRRLMAATGGPLALLVLAAPESGVPPLAWGGAAVLGLLLYPPGAWRDAPWFPTPAGGLAGLAQACAAHPPLAVLDAGCGVGHGLVELRRQFPTAELHGIESSRLLLAMAARRCRWARLQQGDIWQASWAQFQLVYVFQRPESMRRAYDKAMCELPAGGWLASLEFEVPGVEPFARLEPGRRSGQVKPVWLYAKGSTAAQAGR